MTEIEELIAAIEQTPPPAIEDEQPRVWQWRDWQDLLDNRQVKSTW